MRPEHPQQGGLAGHRFIGRKWTPQLPYARAVQLTEQWYKAMVLLVDPASAGPWTLWLPDAKNVQGYEFVPLLSLEDVVADALAMSNCLVDFARAIHRANFSSHDRYAWLTQRSQTEHATASPGM